MSVENSPERLMELDAKHCNRLSPAKRAGLIKYMTRQEGLNLNGRQKLQWCRRYVSYRGGDKPLSAVEWFERMLFTLRERNTDIKGRIVYSGSEHQRISFKTDNGHKVPNEEGVLNIENRLCRGKPIELGCKGNLVCDRRGVWWFLGPNKKGNRN